MKPSAVSMRRSGGGRGSSLAFLGATSIHLVAAVVLITSTATTLSAPPVYRVELVAAPRPEPNRRPAPDVVQRPAEQAIPIERPPRRTSAAETPPPPTKQPEVEREPAARTNPDTLAPDVEPSTGSDPATVSLEGIEFMYPAYLRNIVSQVHRRWNPPRRNVTLRAEVQFFIHRDGSVSNFRFLKRSGSFGFDLEAQGAIESAASTNAFGPLPDGYPADVLPVSFFFDPSSGR